MKKAAIEKIYAARESDRTIIDLAKYYRIPNDIYTPKSQRQLVESGQKFGWILNLWSPHILK